MVLTGRQSEPYTDAGELDEALEFWQADPGRRHRRLRYERGGAGWSQVLLWP